MPLTIFFLYASGLLYWSVTHTTLSPVLTIGLFFVGWLVFTWVEYNVHRNISHMPIDTRKREELQYTLHGVHHEFPKDKDRLAMPPVISITISTILLLLL